MEDRLKNKLIELVNNPYDLNINLDLGFLYEEQAQLASAISHYLRAAEHGLDSNHKDKRLLITESLLRAAICMDKLGGRNYSTKGLILHAISHLPSLPQAHLQMSKIYETTNEWAECNAACSTGIEFIESYQNLRYDGRTKDEVLNELLYQKAVSNYYLGKTYKARIDLLSLKRRPNLQGWILAAVDRSLNTIGYTDRFNQINYDSLPNKSTKPLFKNNSFVSYSQCMQDVFVSSIINKYYGTYVEIGSHDPILNNNTNLLETVYSWRGVSVDIDQNIVNKFNSTRKNKAITADATKVDYKQLFVDNNLPNEIDYLQVDCEPATTTFEVLKRIPFDEYKFGIITFEHDHYKKDSNVRAESREFLESKGYELIIADVAHNCLQSFEDWWGHPEVLKKYISKENFYSVKDTSPQPKCVLDIFIN
jgi:hypothetical protein